ncbi:hypothetical protein [Gayadomonas joobiniege]|uniref:hypothetical protein n=1 Tax=Gayadomonas joobiniege TaxID=1234606 RepID=UPI000364F70B|nr:hypothetical protein [Gayadomonas joobiniege]
MKIGILIPLKAKAVAKNWQEVANSAYQTVQSVLHQTNSCFSVALVGHDCPENLTQVTHAGKPVFVPFDAFPPPVVNPTDEMLNQKNYEIDRCSKILKGMQVLAERDSDITHWFALDADDLLHKNFVSTLIKAGDHQGFIIENGYFYFAKWKIFNATNEFYYYCGSSAVISQSLFTIPDTLTKDSYRGMPFGAISHVHMKEYFEKNNLIYFIPQEKLLMYVRANGDNISDGYLDSGYKKLRAFASMLAKYSYLSKSEKKAFGL